MISLISFGLKLYLVDFSAVPPLDADGYILHAISIKNGEFSEPPRKTQGWPLFASSFLYLTNSDNFIDYANILRGLSIAISTASVPMMYLLARKFFSAKYSLIAACLFGFEPHLNQIAGQGLSEPLYILVIMLSFYFILDKKTSYLSFLFAGFLWWIRWPGVVMFFVISIIYFVNTRSTKMIPRYLICILIFLAVVSPMLIHRYEQYGDPFHFSLSDNFFTGEYGALLAENTKSTAYSAGNYIEENNIVQFLYRFVLTGIYNMFEQIVRISFPYLIVFLPFGIIFSFRAFEQNPKHVRANWILLLVTLATLVVSFSLIPERRFLFYLYPFLILFCVIPINRVVEYGLSTFSYSKRKKNILLFVVVAAILCLSIGFAQRFIPDTLAEKEKNQFGQYMIDNLNDGKILISNEDWRYGVFLKISKAEYFKDFKINYNEKKSINESIDNPFVSLYAKSTSDLIAVGEQYDLKYLVLMEHEYSTWYEYLADVYKNESKYTYLTKVYESENSGFHKFKVKVFEIDYVMWNKLQKSNDVQTKSIQ